MKVTIRDAQVIDAVALANLYTRGWQFAYRGLIPSEYLDSLNAEARLPHWEQTLAVPVHQRTSTRKVAVQPASATLPEKVLGVVSYGSDRDNENGAAEIYTLYAQPEHVGKGVGYALMHYALNELTQAGFSSVVLWVLEGNQRALDFYQRQGFTITGAVKEETMGDVVLRDLQMKRALTSPS